MDEITYGFLDESPNLTNKSSYFSVVIVLTTDQHEKNYQSIFKKIRKNELKGKKKDVPELKFAYSTDRVRTKVLQAISKRAIKVSAFVIDKAGRRIPDTPENYGVVVGFAVSEALKKYPIIVLTVDKKYTKPQDQEEVEKTTLRVVGKISKKGVLQFKEHADSKNNSILQMADFIAGAINYKYNFKDDTYSKIIEDLIEQERLDSWPEIKTIYKQ